MTVTPSLLVPVTHTKVEVGDTVEMEDADDDVVAPETNCNCNRRQMQMNKRKIMDQANK